MLDAHPELAIPPETDFVPEVTVASEGAAQPAEAFLASLIAHWRLRDLQIPWSAVERDVRRLHPFDLAEAFRVVYRTYAAKFAKTRWGDKSPHYLLHMPLIARVLPEARFIHVIRDGRAVWLSIRDLWFGPNTVDDAARWWQDSIVAARHDALSVPNYTEVRFERLVLEPEVTLRELCSYLELQWDDELLRSHERAPERISEVITDFREGGRLTATVADRHRIHAWTVRPPEASRIDRWRDELPAAEVAAFERIAGGTLASLGYERP